MSNRKVYIAVNLDLGWDNVIGAYDSYDKAFDACRPTVEELDGEDGEWYASKVCDRTGMYDMHHIHTKEIQ